ncbi:hypothetical protein JG687_00014429, partial [Phytophthora cactorum]
QHRLITGFADRFIGLPPLHACLRLRPIPNLSQAIVIVDQFAVVSSFACTTEKLQGNLPRWSCRHPTPPKKRVSIADILRRIIKSG